VQHSQGANGWQAQNLHSLYVWSVSVVWTHYSAHNRSLASMPKPGGMGAKAECANDRWCLDWCVRIFRKVRGELFCRSV